MKVRSALHEHLKYTSDVDGMLEKMLNLTLSRLGPGSVVGFVNFADRRYETIMKDALKFQGENLGNAFYFPNQDILVIKGQEVPTREGHLLVLGMEEGFALDHDKPALDTLKESKDRGYTTVVDHEFLNSSLMRIGLGLYLLTHLKALEYVDATEIHNNSAEVSRIPFLFNGSANPMALDAYNARNSLGLKTGALSTSDSHYSWDFARCYTYIDFPNRNALKNADSVKTALSKGVKNTTLDDCVISHKYLGFLAGTNHSMATVLGVAKRLLKRN